MEVKVFGLPDMIMLSGEPGTCPECAVKHEPELPHKIDSLFYQMKFHQASGRWPTREDAFAHVSPELRAAWERLEVRVAEERRDHGHGT